MKTKKQTIDVLTVIGITAVVWPLFAFAHEIIGHGVSAFMLGEEVRGAVSTTVHIHDFYNLDHVSDRIGWWGFRIVASAGTIVNLITGAIALILLHSRRVANTHLRYGLFLLATISIFQQAFWMAIMPFVKLGGDWTAFFIELDYGVYWRTGITIIGLALLGLGYYLPLYFWKPNFGAELKKRKSIIRKLTFIPILSAFIIQFLSILGSPLSGPRHTIIPAIFSFIPFIIWLIPANTISKLWVCTNAPETVLTRNYFWIVAGLITSFLFIVVLGMGIGSFEGHPDY